jgi:anti-anti-sigma factor
MYVVPRPLPETPAYSFAVLRVDATRASLAAVGELDLAAVGELEALMAAHEDRSFIRLDLSAVTFMDCSCLGVHVGVHQRLRLRQGQLILTDLSAPVARLLAVTARSTDLLTSTETELLWGGASA